MTASAGRDRLTVTVTDAAVEAAAKVTQHYEFCDRGETWRDCVDCREIRASMAEILTVAAPLLEARLEPDPALGVACSFCGVEAGQRCVGTNPITKVQFPTRPHKARVLAALAALDQSENQTPTREETDPA